MKLTSRELAYALHDYNKTAIGEEAVEAFAQYLLEHPSATVQHDAALRVLGLDGYVPNEATDVPIPHVNEGTHAVRSGLDTLSKLWDVTPVHRLVALKALAWACEQLARSEQRELRLRYDRDVEQNGGVAAGLWVSAAAMQQQKGNLKFYLRRPGASGDSHPKRIEAAARKSAAAAAETLTSSTTEKSQ